MAEPNAAAQNANPDPSGSAAASAASASSTTAASPPANASSATTAQADSFIQAPSASPPAEDGLAAGASAPAAIRPDWLPETLWDAEKGAKADDIKALFTDAEKARARAAEVPKSAGEYKPELPKIAGLPEGVTVDVKDPRFLAAAEVAHAAGLSQKEFSALLGVEAQRVIAQQAQVAEAIKARDAALGPNKTARIDALSNFFKTIAPNEKVAGELGKMLVTPGIIETWEGVQKALGSQGAAGLSRAATGGPGSGKVEGYDQMSMTQKLAHFGHL